MKELPIFNKPKQGEPCNNCGFCCVEEACMISQVLFGDARTPCAALESVGDNFLCGLIRSPGKYVPELTKEGQAFFTQRVGDLLGVGKGCCANDL